MKRRRVVLAAALATAALWGAPVASAQTVLTGDLTEWLAELDASLARASSSYENGASDEARTVVLRAYLDYFEPIEGIYGRGGEHTTAELGERVFAAETRFHALLRERDAAAARDQVVELSSMLTQLGTVAQAAGVPLRPTALPVVTAAPGETGWARTPEVGAILAGLRAADEAYQGGDPVAALRHVEHAYLEGFEPLEPRLPGALVDRIERLFHLSLRPAIASRVEAEVVSGAIAALSTELLEADAALGSTGAWFGAVNSFAIIVREGLEAVLIVAALLAYLGAVGAGTSERRKIWLGAGLGIVASLATWVVARTTLPISGAGRELVEGITGLVAVAVLLYVSNWLFQKTYIHDWKEYLREHVQRAVGTGSTFAMAGLSFAAVYREGFETVLFYQALLFDAGPAPVLAGFVAGALIIAVVGYAIIRLGLKLPLRRVFAVTNALLIYLAFVFVGKSVYNLQEAGLFAPLPVSWLPDSGALRQVFGFYPTAETALSQLAFLALVGASYAFYRQRGRARARERAKLEGARRVVTA